MKTVKVKRKGKEKILNFYFQSRLIVVTFLLDIQRLESCFLPCNFLKRMEFCRVGDPDPSDPYVFGLLDPDPLVRGTDPDPSIIKQK